jgi:methyl-accepting chemotaxis protein
MISGTAFYLLAQQRLAEEFYSAHSQIKTTMEMLLPWMIIVYVLGILITFFLTMVYTRRLAGPILRFDREFNKISNGDYTTRITLRRRDEFQDFAAKVNEVTSFTGNNFRLLSESHEQIQDAILKLDEQKDETDENGRIEEFISKVKIASQQLDSVLTNLKF